MIMALIGFGNRYVPIERREKKLKAKIGFLYVTNNKNSLKTCCTLSIGKGSITEI